MWRAICACVGGFKQALGSKWGAVIKLSFGRILGTVLLPWFLGSRPFTAFRSPLPVSFVIST